MYEFGSKGVIPLQGRVSRSCKFRLTRKKEKSFISLNVFPKQNIASHFHLTSTRKLHFLDDLSLLIFGQSQTNVILSISSYPSTQISRNRLSCLFFTAFFCIVLTKIFALIRIKLIKCFRAFSFALFLGFERRTMSF